MENRALWEKAVAFHGHSCGGLAIGYKAAMLVHALFGEAFSEDEELVCVAENDACGIDAIQSILGCSAGKGNLMFRLRGKQAFSFFDRKSGKAVRLVLRDRPKAVTRGSGMEWTLSQPAETLFDVKAPAFTLPEPARIFQSVHCESCGETTAETMLRLEEGRKLCLDCYRPYTRFDV